MTIRLAAAAQITFALKTDSRFPSYVAAALLGFNFYTQCLSTNLSSAKLLKYSLNCTDRPFCSHYLFQIYN